MTERSRKAPVLWTAVAAAAATNGTTAGNWTASGVSIDTRTLEPGDLFDADDALVTCLVGQPGRPCQIADGVKTRFPGLAPEIGHQVILGHLDFQALDTEILHVAHDADSRNDPLNLDPAVAILGFQGCAHLALTFFEPGHLGPGEDRDALGLESLVGKSRNFLVLDGRMRGRISTSVTSAPKER